MGREVVKIRSSKQDQSNEHFTYNEREAGVIVFTLMKNIDPIPKGRGHHKVRDSRKVFYVYGTNDIYADLTRAQYKQLPNMGSWFEQYIPYDFDVWPLRTTFAHSTNDTDNNKINHNQLERIVFSWYVRKFGLQKVRAGFFKVNEPTVPHIDQILTMSNLRNEYSNIKFPPVDA
jgi:hypothetical protein